MKVEQSIVATIAQADTMLIKMIKNITIMHSDAKKRHLFLALLLPAGDVRR